MNKRGQISEIKMRENYNRLHDQRDIVKLIPEPLNPARPSAYIAHTNKQILDFISTQASRLTLIYQP